MMIFTLLILKELSVHPVLLPSNHNYFTMHALKCLLSSLVHVIEVLSVLISSIEDGAGSVIEVTVEPETLRLVS